MSLKFHRVWVVTALCLAAASTVVRAADPSMFDGRPTFKEGEGRGYYVWRDGDTWHVRWTTFGATHRFTGTVTAEGGKLDSLKRIDVETERRVIAPGRPGRVVVGPRGRARVVGGKAPIVETRDQDHIDKDGDRRITFRTLTNDDIDGFDFKVKDGVKLLRFSLQMDELPRPREVEVGRSNQHVAADPFIVNF